MGFRFGLFIRAKTSKNNNQNFSSVQVFEWFCLCHKTGNSIFVDISLSWFIKESNIILEESSLYSYSQNFKSWPFCPPPPPPPYPLAFFFANCPLGQGSLDLASTTIFEGGLLSRRKNGNGVCFGERGKVLGQVDP